MFTLVSFVLLAVAAAAQESHTVSFSNNCGTGTPMLIQGPNVLSTGADVTIIGPLISAIAYLQTGPCLFNGEGCTLVETTLTNPTSPGAGSSSDISLVPPHAFNVAAGFSYVGGCTNGEDCTSATCPGAFTDPTNGALIACEADNVGLVITFCE